uniref:Uncharacterized protein n=1 Tax=Peronospora matthiolae TaxID=2874970 RepID=A0AAV1T1C8_9STRA
MATRNTRSWRRFLSTLLHSPDSQSSSSSSSSRGDPLYDGVCVFTLSGCSELFSDGCFHSSSSAFLDVDPLQLVALFEQLTRQAIQEATHVQRESGTPSIRLGATVFHVVSATFSSFCAVTSGKTSGLVVQKLPFGLVVVAFSAPQRLETVFGHLDAACAALRR